MTQEIYWELLAWLFRSFLAVYRPSRNAVPLFKGNVFDLMGH